MNSRLPRGVTKKPQSGSPNGATPRLGIGRVERLKRWKSGQANCDQLSRGKAQPLSWFFRKLLIRLAVQDSEVPS
jgi:hypothetical protein